jgi:hypothetical protein
VEFNAGLDALEKGLRAVEGVDSTIVDQVIAMGMVSVLDVEEVGPDPLVKELEMDRDLAQRIVVHCAEEAKRLAEEQAAKAKEPEAPAEAPAEPAAEAEASEAVAEAPEPPADAEAEAEPVAEEAAEPVAEEAAEPVAADDSSAEPTADEGESKTDEA